MDKKFAVERYEPGRGWIALPGRFDNRDAAERILKGWQDIGLRLELRVYEVTHDPKRREEG